MCFSAWAILCRIKIAKYYNAWSRESIPVVLSNSVQLIGGCLHNHRSNCVAWYPTRRQASLNAAGAREPVDVINKHGGAHDVGFRRFCGLYFGQLCHVWSTVLNLITIKMTPKEGTDILSQVELILPSHVVETCYTLQTGVEAEFLATNILKKSLSRIKLFKLPDRSVKITLMGMF